MSRTGDIIQEMRVRAGFTQKTLAEALHITDKAISKWERGICFPDISLLSKLALLLDIDVNQLVSTSLEENDWVGFISIQGCDLSQKIYDKPMVYYLLSHYLLLGIKDIYIVTEEINREYLEKSGIEQFGFHFIFSEPKEKNVMAIKYPWFIFGSDLTQMFQGSMLSERTIRLKPENQQSVFYFIPKRKNDILTDNSNLDKKCSTRTLGRGMIVFDMGDYDKCLDVASFVKAYQVNTGMLIGSLEEIAYRQGIISDEELKEIAGIAPYGDYLKRLLINYKSIDIP